jgi:hypothetical protein
MYRIDWRWPISIAWKISSFSRTPWLPGVQFRPSWLPPRDWHSFLSAGGQPPEGRRELIVKFSDGGYLVLYDVEGDRVRILRLRYMREDRY